MHPILETERLYVRPFIADDLPMLCELQSDYEVMRYHPGDQPRSYDRSAKDLQAFMQHHDDFGYSFWAVFKKSDHQFIGRTGLWHLDKTERVELGYVLFKKFWGQGFATEIGREVLNSGFEKLNLSEIFAVIHPENFASQRVAKKLGFNLLKQTICYNMQVKLYQQTKEYYLLNDANRCIAEAHSI